MGVSCSEPTALTASHTLTPFALGVNARGQCAKKNVFMRLYFIEEHLQLTFRKIPLPPSFIHRFCLCYLIVQRWESHAQGLFTLICIFKWKREESGTPTCVLNSTLIGMYKGNVLGFMRTHSFIHLDFFALTTFLDLSVQHVSVGNPCKSLYMRPLGKTKSPPECCIGYKQLNKSIFNEMIL